MSKFSGPLTLHTLHALECFIIKIDYSKFCYKRARNGLERDGTGRLGASNVLKTCALSFEL